MSATSSSKSRRNAAENNSKTPIKRARTPSLKALESISTAEESDGNTSLNRVHIEESDSEAVHKGLRQRRSTRKKSPNKKFDNFVTERSKPRSKKSSPKLVDSEDTSDENREQSEGEVVDGVSKPDAGDIELLQEDYDVTGKNMFGFNTPKRRGGMALAAMNTPKTLKTPKTPKTSRLTTKTPDAKRQKSTTEHKTPTHIRSRVRNQIAKLLESDSDQGDFSADESDFEPADNSDSSSASASSSENSGDEDEPKTPHKTRRPIIVPVLPKTPSANPQRQSARAKKFTDYVPMCDAYFQAQSSSKILTSDHTLDRLKNPRLPADRLFSLLAQMKLSTEHETSINALRNEYRTYFPKWMCILNEGYNLLLYGLGSKRQLLQTFHREVLSQQSVIVVNGFFPSLMLKDILDSITNDLLDAGPSPGNAHEAVDMIEEEFSLIPGTHLYLIIHNLDGTMLRNVKSQEILSRLAKIPNIHLLASVDHINIPLLWDQTKLSNFNFSWWDCTTLLPYADETAFENSLLVQNSGELALSSMRSVFSSLTTNSRGIYMLIVKHQLKNKNNQNYQGMAFKDLYSACREAFLVSSDLALRAQLTEFLDHKLVKSKRSVDGTEQLIIPIDAAFLQQFLDEQEKKD